MYRYSVYDLLRRIFLWEFPLELFKEVIETAKAESSSEETEYPAEAKFRAFVKTLDSGGLADLHRELHIEYTRLFVGPRKLPAPPYESVYRSPDKLLMQDETFDVRAAYARSGFQVAKSHNVPDDSIGIELEFMCVLNKTCIDAFNEQNYSKALMLASAQKEFCDNHLLKWIPEFCDDIAAKSTSQFWQNVAVFTREYVQEEPTMIGNIMDTLTELAEEKSHPSSHAVVDPETPLR
jgi:putative dimethyl sulfoxide reductase chaperone